MRKPRSLVAQLPAGFIFGCILYFSALSASADVIKLAKMTFESHNKILSCFADKPISFSPHSDQFEKNNAYDLALFSFLAYSDMEVAEDTVKKLGFTKVKFISAKKQEWKTLPSGAKRRILADTEGIWAENDEFVVLAFEGTVVTNRLNLLTDLMAKRVPMGRLGKVHSGFYGALTIAWPQIMKLLEEVKTSKPVFLTGHSLGAALAILTTVKMLQHEERRKLKGDSVKDGPYLQGLYTFGAPKVGDKKFAASVEKLFSDTGGGAYSIRYVHNNDLVPHLPLFSLTQIDSLQYFDSKGQEHNGENALQELSHPLAFLKRYFFLNIGIDDHDMRYYLEDTYLNLTGQLSHCI